MNNFAPMPMHGERELPWFTLRVEDMPEVRAWDVGSDHYLILKVKTVGKRVREDLETRNDRAKTEGDFQVLSVRALGRDPVDAETLERQDFERTVAMARSGTI